MALIAALGPFAAASRAEDAPPAPVPASVPAPAPAASPKPATLSPRQDYTFHMVKAPSPGTKPKIDVQIDPVAQAAWLAAKPKEPVIVTPAAAALPKPGSWDWFWNDVSTKADEAGPANVAKALTALAERPGAPAPRLQALKTLADLYGKTILGATVGTDVSPALVLALISVESNGQEQVASHKGAIGLMQLIPATADRFGVEDATDPTENIKGGVAYLAWLMKHFGRDPILALAGYNAGENAVTQYGGVPPYAETRAYVPKVLNAWRVAKGLCLTPPELITDGCVFAGEG